ncbi:MAG: DUF423 domain-containing protein [Candidatus Sedimenticola sp. (ex Thyasira tokunagai)]
MTRLFTLFGAINGFLTVALGAFGAHMLRGEIEPRLYAAFQTGVEYQGIHALALLFIGMLAEKTTTPWINRSGWLILTGITLFSGSLYLMALTGVGTLGMITPIGGISLLFGWLALAFAALNLPKR